MVAVPRPLAALAVLGLDQDHHPGAHPPVGGEPGDELVGESLHHEHDRLELLDRLVEGMLDPPSGMGIDRRGRAQIGPSGEPVGVQADRAEPRQHVACVERRQPTERADAEPHEQVDQLGIDLAQLAQPADRQRFDELGRASGGDDRARVGRRRAAIRAAIAEADRPSAMPTPIGPHRSHGDDRHDPLGERMVAAEVARRAAGGDAQPPWFDDLDARCHVGDRPHDRLELAGVAVGVAFEHLQLGARSLRHASPVAVAHADRACGRRAGDHAVGVEHGGRHVWSACGRRPSAIPGTTG